MKRLEDDGWENASEIRRLDRTASKVLYVGYDN